MRSWETNQFTRMTAPPKSHFISDLLSCDYVSGQQGKKKKKEKMADNLRMNGLS